MDQSYRITLVVTVVDDEQYDHPSLWDWRDLIGVVDPVIVESVKTVDLEGLGYR
jgi:hypothetical protein